MKTLIQAAVVTFFAASVAQAQQAVQWRMEDGGNGHWYEGVRAPGISWHQSRLACTQAGGDLVTIASSMESNWVFQNVAYATNLWWTSNDGPRHGPWIGLFQDTSAVDYAEPAGGWRWVDGSAPQFTAWAQSNISCENQPSDCRCNPAEGCGMNFGSFYAPAPCPGGCTTVPTWAAAFDNMGQYAMSYIVEWSADCNSDGVVDYGQCREGSLPDYNGNNVPDCCERGEACVPGHYPVQWKVSDGGNGHWYRLVVVGSDISWANASDQAHQAGGYLASLTSSAENDWLHELVVRHPSAFATHGPWLGGRLLKNQWGWESGERWGFTAWTSANPSGDGSTMGYWDITNPAAESWNDAPESNTMVSLVIEWSADCNHDGVVDYGQILLGQLADLNTDGVPDICQQPTCADADLFRDFNVNGADLGILLSQWGPRSPLTVSDINSDGVVNGADLGLLLSFWGGCP